MGEEFILKEKVVDECRAVLARKIAEVGLALRQISESLENETKSSLGDKHETSRARMHSEQEKLSSVLTDLQEQQRKLERLPLVLAGTAKAGSLVMTDKNLFLLAIPLGKVVVLEKTVYVISTDSPLGKQMLGLQRGDQFSFNGLGYTIMELQ
jgi:hypothetical protein